MRELGSRSIAVILTLLLVSGCSSTGGKPFSWSSLNPMTYFADSDSDPVPKPSDQMAPSVSFSNESEMAANGGIAPPSPYTASPSGVTQDGIGDSYSGQYARANSQSATVSPQQGLYDPNSYSGASLPVSPPSYGSGSPYTSPAAPDYGAGTSGYAMQQSAANGYQTPSGPAGTGYSASSSDYALGGSRYDPQGYNQGTGLGTGSNDYLPSNTGPAYASPGAPYASDASTGPSVGPSYQSPPLPNQGYGTGLAQDPYPNSPPSSSNMNGNSTAPWGTGANMSGPESYADSSLSNPPERQDYGGLASRSSTPPLPTDAGGYGVGNTAYEPGSTGYDPGNTGYSPNTPQYTPPTGGYVQPAAASEPGGYAPGSVSRYNGSTSSPAASTGSTTGGYGTNGGTNGLF